MYIMFRLEETFNYALQTNVQIIGRTYNDINTIQAINDGDLATYYETYLDDDAFWEVKMQSQVAVKNVEYFIFSFFIT